jgi:hypothetical protein
VAYAVAVVPALFVWAQVIWAPLNTAWLSGRALTASEEGRPADAGSLLERAVTNEPDAAGVAGLLGRGLLLQAQSLTTQAAQVEMVSRADGILGRPLARNPLDFRVRQDATTAARALALLGAKPWPYAVRAAATEIALRPNNVRLYIDLANLYIDAGDLDAASAVLDMTDRMKDDPRTAPTDQQARSIEHVRGTIASKREEQTAAPGG